MKHSIKKQLALTFIGLMAAALIVIALVNYFFLGRYYQNHKEQMIEDAYTQLDAAENLSQSFPDAFNQTCSKNNLSVLVVDSTLQYVVNTTTKDPKNLAVRLWGFYSGMYPERISVIDRTEHYTIQTTDDKEFGLSYLEMWGTLTSGDYFIIRTPLESITDAVHISNLFYTYVGVIVIIASACIMWWYARRFTKPITELTDISQRMTSLDFEAKYQSRGQDEIDVLGENFNKMSGELESTISELKSANVELMRDNERKTQIDEMRKEFLDNVSHELKTPIALIQGYAEGLKDNVNDDPESRDFYCDVIMDEAVKMNGMVKKLLTLNKLENGNQQINMERFDIVDLIHGVIQASQILIEDTDVTISFCDKEPVYVWGDEFEIEEVVTNYLTNAIHHVKNENRIDICLQQVDGVVRVSVFNSGDPIPQEDIDKVWIKFYKVDKARTREYGGSGIGLSIVKAIMDGHHQKCGVCNYDNGVEFWFTLESK